jgi:hypothetical protein
LVEDSEAVPAAGRVLDSGAVPVGEGLEVVDPAAGVVEGEAEVAVEGDEAEISRTGAVLIMGSSPVSATGGGSSRLIPGRFLSRCRIRR